MTLLSATLAFDGPAYSCKPLDLGRGVQPCRAETRASRETDPRRSSCKQPDPAHWTDAEIANATFWVAG